jgi:hypothetical protein
MPPYPNLVSDSTLVQDTIDLLTCSGGRAAASEIVDAVFKLSHIDDELAGLLVADLIRDDRRFKIIENNTVELLADDSQSRQLKDLDSSNSVLIAFAADVSSTSSCRSSILRFRSRALLRHSPASRTRW